MRTTHPTVVSAIAIVVAVASSTVAGVQLTVEQETSRAEAFAHLREAFGDDTILRVEPVLDAPFSADVLTAWYPKTEQRTIGMARNLALLPRPLRARARRADVHRLTTSATNRSGSRCQNRVRLCLGPYRANGLQNCAHAGLHDNRSCERCDHAHLQQLLHRFWPTAGDESDVGPKWTGGTRHRGSVARTAGDCRGAGDRDPRKKKNCGWRSSRSGSTRAARATPSYSSESGWPPSRSG